MKRFEELAVGEEFRFVPSAPGYGTFSQGKTFVKTTARKYQLSGECAEAEMRHQRQLFGKKARLPEYKVGSVEVEVISLRKEEPVAVS